MQVIVVWLIQGEAVHSALVWRDTRDISYLDSVTFLWISSAHKKY